MAEFDFSDLNSDNNSQQATDGGMDFSDLNSDNQQPEPKAPPTKMESFSKGLQSGISFGLSDELAGSIGKLLELLPGSSTSQDEALKAQGFDLPASPTYKSIRDEERAVLAAAEKANPMTYLGGNIAGGAMVAPAMGLNTISGATKGAKIADAAIKAGAAGAATGFGVSEATNATDLAKDVALGGTLGAATGGLIQASPGAALTGAGLGAVGGAALSDDTTLEGRALNAAKYGTLGLGAGAVLGGAKQLTGAVADRLPTLTRAYEKGLKEGVKTYSKEFADETSKKASTLVDDITNTVNESRLNKIKDTENNIKNIDTKMNAIESDIKADLKATKELETGINKGNERKLSINTDKFANKIQQRFGEAKKLVGDTYDKIETEIPENTLFDTQDVVFNFQKDLENNGLLGDQAASLANRFKENAKIDQLSFNEIKNFRTNLVPLMESANPAIKRAAINAYKNLNNIRANTLLNNPDPQVQKLAQTLADTDKRWAAILDIEDAVLGKINYDKKTGEVFTDRILKENIEDSSTKRLIKQTLQGNENLQDTPFFRKMELINPEKAQDLVSQYEELANLNRSVQNFKPNLATPEEAIANNVELMRLKELRDKLVKPQEVVTQTDQLMQGNEKQIRDYVGQNLSALENPTMDTKKSNIQNVLDAYEKLTGKNITKEATELVKDVDLVKDAANPIRGSITPRSLGFLESAGQIPTNIAGRVQRTGQTVAKAVSEGDIVGTVNYLKNIKKPEARIYEQQLMDAAAKGPEARNAVMFSLMQQPGFRAIMNVNKDREQEK